MGARVLLTGGAGYIGSHTCAALCEAGYDVVVLDDFSNSDPSVIDRLSRLAGRRIAHVDADVADPVALDAVFASSGFDAVLHFAARKSVPQSIARPGEFFGANIAGLLNLIDIMTLHRVTRIVYSSSATVYGQPEALPIPEHAPLSYTNPYGLSKLVGEQFLNRQRRAGWAVGILRYFNPAGAHPSGLIGEQPVSDGGNLMPLIARVARGEVPQVEVFGDDYGTHDGTGIRDFIHVCDLAQGHVQSLDRLLAQGRSHTVNLGRGRGYSVLDVIKTYEAVSGRAVPYRFRPRRAGDVAASFADPSMAEQVLGFRARRDLTEMCRSSWQWESRRPTAPQPCPAAVWQLPRSGPAGTEKGAATGASA